MEITKEQIEQWKKEYGKIYKIAPIPDIDIYYRLVTRDDYISILNAQASGEITDPEIETIKLCILNDIDDDILKQHGGIATVIYEDLMKRSGFVLVESEEL